MANVERIRWMGRHRKGGYRIEMSMRSTVMFNNRRLFEVFYMGGHGVWMEAVEFWDSEPHILFDYVGPIEHVVFFNTDSDREMVRIWVDSVIVGL